MADNTYTIDELVTGPETVTLTDDGTGIDEITVAGLYGSTVEINLHWTNISGQATSGEGIYFTSGTIGHRLIVTGVIENATGSNGQDFIQGNQLGNLIYGDAKTGLVGRADTLWGAAGNDTIFGGAGADGIQGDDDDDLLFGGSGNDTVNGGAGVDTVQGGAGADALNGGASARDTVSYAASAAGVQIAITFGAAATGTGGDAAGDTLSGFYDVIGSALADRIEDTDKGTIAFGQNDNAFYGGAGRDFLLLGGGNDTGQGGAGNDHVVGEVGDDLLFGGTGHDQLRGSRGQDSIAGGAGADDFIFALTADSTLAVAQRDTILDFSTAEQDRIDLTAIDAKANVAGNQQFHFIGAAGFGGGEGALRAVVSGSDIIVYGDTDGDRHADFAILVLNMAGLAVTDFLL